MSVRDATLVLDDTDTEQRHSVVGMSREADEDSATTVLDTDVDGTLTSFAGTVSGLAGVFSCTDDICAVPTDRGRVPSLYSARRNRRVDLHYPTPRTARLMSRI